MNALRLLCAVGLLGAAWLASSRIHRPGLSAPGAGRGERRNASRRMWSLGRRGDIRRASGACWARRSELSALSVRRPRAGRLSLGLCRGRLLAAEPGSSVLVVGPTQSRKTSGFAIPAVLEWEGPVVAASVKSDLARNTLEWRKSKGEVRVYDPSGATGLHCSSWSPLAAARTWSGARRVAASLTEVARSSAGSLSDGDFWYATAAKLLAPHLMAAALSRRTMADVVRWLDEQELSEALESLHDRGAVDAIRALRASCERDERQRSAVYTTAETVVEPFADPVVASSDRGVCSGDDVIDPSRLLEGANTLYLCAPAHDQRRLRPLFATLVTQVIGAAYERAEHQGHALDPRLLVVLDEAANVAPVAELDVLASTAAGHGVQLVTIWQDLGQLHARYGTRAATVVNNHRAKVFLSGIADPQTLEHASTLIGEAEHDSFATTFDGRSASSTTRSPVMRRLLPADALRRIPPGSAVLVSGHLPPVRLSLRPWQDDPVLHFRATGQQHRGRCWPLRRSRL